MNEALGQSMPPAPGLTGEEARRRRQQYGSNAVAPTAPTAVRQLLAKFWAPVPWLLEVAILLQFMLHEYLEALVIAVLLVFNAALGWFQQQRAQATLDALKSQLALLAVVRRDGLWRTLAATELVPGDVVKLSLGAIVPADVRLVQGDILVDQSMLTGESLPIEAAAGAGTYAGSLVRRGEAVAEVTATGERTRFGRTAELVRVAHGRSTQQQTVLRVVRNLAVFSATLVCVQLAYATADRMTGPEMIPLVLTAVLAAIPVALPATFTLASAVAAKSLAALGVLPTRLSAVDEAATLDVLCSDKTGTLTQNALAVSAVHACAGWDEARVLGLAALASADSGTDPVDAAIRSAAARTPAKGLPTRTRFVPFDPARKMSEADARDIDGQALHIVKGAFARVAQLTTPVPEASSAVRAFEAQGYRVLAVAATARSPPSPPSPPSPSSAPAFVGLIALSDPPRPDAGPLIRELEQLGVRTVMATGDSAATASVVARAVGLQGPVCSATPLPERIEPGEYAVFAGIFPEDKFHIVRAFQASGHTVGMCGDGANDAPALRQAQMGIAVSTATDVAKSAAGIVLTRPGLSGIVQAIRAGRVTYQRILTYTLRSVTTKINQMLFLTVGLFITGHAILTPMLMVLVMISGDFLAMSATTDRVRPSPQPNAWRIGRVTVAAVVLGICDLLFCVAILIAGLRSGLAPGEGLRTLAAVTLVCASQASFYVVRDRRHLWSSRPSLWVVLSSLADVTIIALFAGNGFLMHAIPWSLIGRVVLAAALFTPLLDGVKSLLFTGLQIRDAVPR
ncbi:MAG TPA: HAD-IC family P-type ATPase [Steroidobacteraceae bacterium]|nr:HAD-IC family P-type ATPase [Steroidobacteraceae bacterium]